MRTRIKAIFAKIEATYGTDSSPIATDAIETMNLNASPYEGNRVQREIDRATLGAFESINTAPYVMFEFAVSLAGAGAAGSVPRYGALLRACGFAETINAGTDVQYDPVSSDVESCTIYYEEDGERQVATGCRGTASFEIGASGYPMINFRMVGLYQKPAGATTFIGNLTGIPKPLPVNRTNTGTCTLDSYALQLQSLSAAMNAETPLLNLPNFEEILYVDRRPAGQLSFRAPTIAEKDIMALVESHNGLGTYPFALVHGLTAGNRIRLDAPAVDVASIGRVDINGELGRQCDITFLPTAGDDEIKLTVS